MDKAVAVVKKLIHSGWLLLHVLCLINAFMNPIAFEFANVVLVRSTETAPFSR